MVYSKLKIINSQIIQEAIRFAIKIHELDTKTKRKGTEIPYITHPLSVAIILARSTDNDEIIAAGVLHDTIEDCEPYGSVTKELLEAMFSKDVARMVNDVTEQDKSLPWAERKAATFAHIKDMKQDSLLVKTADVVQNLSELLNDIETHGVNVFKRFNAPKDATIDRYKKLLAEITRVWPENPLLLDLESGVNKLLMLTKNT